MKKFQVRVTETIDHMYEFLAENEEQALALYYKLSYEQLKENDIDGQVSWDRPWTIDEVVD
jgi:hypothetical protein